jgi:flagellar biosynthesis protein FliR
MPRHSTRAILSPTSRRLVAGLLIAAGILLVLAQLLRVYVLVVNWRAVGLVSAEAVAGVALGLGAGMLTSYIGWRVGRGG